jgi:hypothetical protein
MIIVRTAIDIFDLQHSRSLLLIIQTISTVFFVYAIWMSIFLVKCNPLKSNICQGKKRLWVKLRDIIYMQSRHCQYILTTLCCDNLQCTEGFMTVLSWREESLYNLSFPWRKNTIVVIIYGSPPLPYFQVSVSFNHNLLKYCLIQRNLSKPNPE